MSTGAARTVAGNDWMNARGSRRAGRRKRLPLEFLHLAIDF